MKFSGIAARRRVAGVAAGCLLGGLAVAGIGAPVASAAPDQCSPAALGNTVDSVTDSARGYLANHPGARGAVTAAFTQPRGEAAANLRNYFTANPGEYYELRGILAPIGEAQRACNTPVLTPQLASAYSEFMAG
jgi:hemophore-related protein